MTIAHDGEVDAATLARVLGVTPRRVQQLVERDGMPKAGRGKYDLAACVQFYVEYWRSRAEGRVVDTKAGAVSLAEEQLKLLQIQRETKELELARLRRQSVNVDDVVELVAEILAPVRARLLNFPGRMARRMVRVPTIVEASERLDGGIQEIMQEMHDAYTKVGAGVATDAAGDADARPDDDAFGDEDGDELAEAEA